MVINDMRSTVEGESFANRSHWLIGYFHHVNGDLFATTVRLHDGFDNFNVALCKR